MTHSVNLRAECRLRWKSRKQSFVAGDVSPEAGSLCRLVPQLNVLPLHLVSGAQRGVVHLVDAEPYLFPELSLDVPAYLNASYLIQVRPKMMKFVSGLFCLIFMGLHIYITPSPSVQIIYARPVLGYQGGQRQGFVVFT